jgi:hypothetical protein
MQSHFSGMTQRKCSLEEHQDFCLLESGCLKSKCNMVFTLLFSGEMAYKMRNLHLQTIFRHCVLIREKHFVELLFLLKMQHLGKNCSEMGWGGSSLEKNAFT